MLSEILHSIMFVVLLTTSIAKHIGDHFGAGFKLNVSNRVCSKSLKYCMFFTTKVFWSRQHTYLAIHEETTSSSSKKVVWIGNRNHPLLNSSSATLTLDKSGVLKILGHNDEDEPIILYCPPPPQSDKTNNNIINNNTSVMATLLDTGNFVLQQIYPNQSKGDFLWQSFDFPSNTLMPGMRLGSDNKTSISWSLASDFSDLSPAPGPFTLEWEPGSKQLIIRYRGQVYWSSGALRDDGKFENIPEEVQLLYHYNVTSNEHEQSFSFTYTTQNHEDDRNNSSPWTLYVDGMLGSEMLEIGNAGNCYGYNKDRGCQLWNQPPCRHVGDLFQVKQVRPKEEGMTIKGYDLSISDCKANCWIDCDCVGFGSFHGGVSCYVVYDQSRGLYVPNDVLTLNYLTTINPNNTRDDDSGTKRNAKIKKIRRLIAITIASLLTIWALTILVLLKKRKLMLQEMKRTRMEHPRHGQDLEEQSNKRENVEGHQNYKTNGQQLRLFSYASILEATNSFSLENKLGEGGFGPVFKGQLQMGKEVAVKRLSRSSRQGIRQFKNELDLISELQHMNLVQLLGCCIHEDERILIYEYMQNKSLDFFLFDPRQSNLLDWKKRFNIIEGIAQGLIYLHKYSRLKVVHRDLKASNILLDESMNPKISDFGLATIITEELERSTTRIAGTCGYMPPESAKGIFSTKSDVYSFGILMLEIISGKRNNCFNNTSQGLNIVGHVWELWKEGLGLELVDETIKDSINKEQVLRCIHVGLLCVEEEANDRPTMADISLMLSSESAKLPSVKRPAFCFVRDQSIVRTCNDSPNGLTMSDLSAR